MEILPCGKANNLPARQSKKDIPGGINNEKQYIKEYSHEAAVLRFGGSYLHTSYSCVCLCKRRNGVLCIQ